MSLDEIDIDDLTEICEGNDSTAELLQRLIRDNPQDNFESQDLRRLVIIKAFADYMNGFWDEDSTDQDGEPVDQDAHWEQNYDWGRELLESIDEWEE